METDDSARSRCRRAVFGVWAEKSIKDYQSEAKAAKSLCIGTDAKLYALQKDAEARLFAKQRDAEGALFAKQREAEVVQKLFEAQAVWVCSVWSAPSEATRVPCWCTPYWRKACLRS